MRLEPIPHACPESHCFGAFHIVLPGQQQPDPRGKWSWGSVLGAVSGVTGVLPNELVGPSRMQHCLEARRLAAYVFYHDKGMTKFRIGEILGGRHHTTIYHLLKKSPAASDIEAVRAALNGAR